MEQPKQYIEYIGFSGFNIDVLATFRSIEGRYLISELAITCPIFEICIRDFESNFIEDLVSGVAFHEGRSFYHFKIDNESNVRFSVGNSDMNVILPIEVIEAIHEFLKISSLNANK